ncbi:MAG: universal stress protein [Candidatus Riflebacteria bacterium]|nr:universal stress protein [Candidatus Riflebacteria bacterium]
MFKKILVAYDGSESSERALVEALDLARAVQAQVIVLAIAEIPFGVDSRLEVNGGLETERHHMHKLVKDALKRLKPEGVKLSTEFKVGHPSSVILKMVADGRPDLVVLGDRGHSTLVSMFLGTTAYNVSRKVPCSVLLVK